MLFVKALAVWIVMVIAAIANGVLREGVLTVYFGESGALPISGMVLSILVLSIIYLTIGIFVSDKSSFYLFLGLFWVGLTLIFEYGFGYFLRGMALGEINQVFNVLSGNLFTLVMLATLFGPLVMANFKGIAR
jgi:hypothetical protein